jgi:iron(III) transport system ATP-binding protein
LQGIVLENVTKRWDHFYAVDNLNMVIEDNAFVTLLGPSGCGKTTTLRMIAGLDTPTSGKITIGGVTVFDSERGINIPANKRDVGFLFQNYALWPNMTVYKNIAFGLTNIKKELPTIDFQARKIASLIDILEKPDAVQEIFEACKDRNGKLSEEKAGLRLMEEYRISQYTAKTLLGFKLFGSKYEAGAVRARLDKLRADLTQIREKHKAEGRELNHRYEVTQSGQVLQSVRKLTKEEIDLIVRRSARTVKIGALLDRYPSELSGGQQQRVAIARTLAPEPKVLFMDEPLSNLDAKLRLDMRLELQRLHVETGITFIYVTHDQTEAMTLATRICLIHNGVLQQYDAPLDVYNRPNNLFVADFVGNPSINFIEAAGERKPQDGSYSMTIFGGIKVKFTPRDEASADGEPESQEAGTSAEKSNKDTVFRYPIAKVNEGEDRSRKEAANPEYVIGVRPEHLNIGESGSIAGEIYSAMPTGMETMVKVRIGSYLLTGVVFGGVLFQIGQQVKLDFSGDNILLFNRESGKLVARGSMEVIE